MLRTTDSEIGRTVGTCVGFFFVMLFFFWLVGSLFDAAVSQVLLRLGITVRYELEWQGGVAVPIYLVHLHVFTGP